MTADELLQYKHEPYRTELIAGRLHEMEPAGALHGVVAAQICHVLAAHVLPRGIGKVFGAETGYILASDPDTVRAPDASFVSRERIEALGGIPSGYWPGPPDVAFEVNAPGDRRSDVESKTRAWIEAGTRAVVVIDPLRRDATVHRRGVAPQSLAGADAVDLDDVLPGFAPRVEDLLA
ncbi:Uma2 family endonuclease [soil metagenome]